MGGQSPLKRAVFFDRDGVLNEAVVRAGAPHPPATLEELNVDPHADAAVAEAHALGLLAIVVTNQPDVARGTSSIDTVERINEAVRAASGADAVYACFHDDRDRCRCRKPAPGLMERAAREHGIDLSASYLIGDRGKDIAAGRAVRCSTVFLDRGYDGEAPPERADAVAKTLREAMSYIRRWESETR